jgi:LPS-assembly protein
VRFTFVIVATLIALGLARPASAVETKQLPQTPATISADRISYDEDLGIIVASGHVEISQEDRVLLADTVTYNQRTDTVTASGNVSLHEPSGEIIYADYIELTEGLKDGVAQNFRLMMQNKARFASTGARREGGVVTEMANGVYSLCALCKDDPERPPLWQLKGSRIIHNEDEHEIYFEDASLEMFGIPVMYSPYFSAPDPTVKRRSGFLTPSFGHDSELGYLYQQPYFWAIDDSKDATISPIFTTESGQVFYGQYRERWGDAQLSLAGSATQTPARNENGDRKPGVQDRGHFNGSGIVNVDENWRTGFDAVRETDDTYFPRYKLLYTPTTSVLQANGYVEGFFGQSYSGLNTYAFQDVRQQVKIKDLPLVTPAYEYNYVSKPGEYGEHWSFDFTPYNIFRSSGLNSRRLSQNTQWELPYTSPYGDSLTWTLALQTDGYSTSNNVNPNNPTATPASEVARALPQTKLDWRYPWVRRDEAMQELIEPHVAFIAGPQGKNNFAIPNEDSQDFEFDDQNLFLLNPFPGSDRVDGGERVVYGVTVGAFGDKGGSSTVFVGQQYQFHKSALFANATGNPNTGLQDNLSDYVGRIQIKPASFFEVNYRFRLDHENLSPQRSEVDAHLGFPLVSFYTNYIDTTQNVPGTGIETVNQVLVGGSSQIANHWTIGGSLLRDLVSREFRYQTFNATYDDECFTFIARITRNFTTNRDIHPGNSFIFQLVFKSLGEVRIGGSG